MGYVIETIILIAFHVQMDFILMQELAPDAHQVVQLVLLQLLAVLVQVVLLFQELHAFKIVLSHV